MKLTPLGIFHTIIGVMAILSAIISLVRFGKINLADWTGKLYFYATLITSLTALGISKRGGFNPGHALSLLVILLILIAWYLNMKKPGNNRSRYFENFVLTFSFFISWLPTVNETLTRLPVWHPLAKDITDPVIAKTLLALLVLFVAGSLLQFAKQRNAIQAAKVLQPDRR